MHGPLVHLGNNTRGVENDSATPPILSRGQCVINMFNYGVVSYSLEGCYGVVSYSSGRVELELCELLDPNGKLASLRKHKRGSSDGTDGMDCVSMSSKTRWFTISLPLGRDTVWDNCGGSCGEGGSPSNGGAGLYSTDSEYVSRSAGPKLENRLCSRMFWMRAFVLGGVLRANNISLRNWTPGGLLDLTKLRNERGAAPAMMSCEHSSTQGWNEVDVLVRSELLLLLLGEMLPRSLPPLP